MKNYGKLIILNYNFSKFLIWLQKKPKWQIQTFEEVYSFVTTMKSVFF